MQAVLFKTPGQEWWWLGGMSLLERNLRLLASAGCETVLILHPADIPLPLLAVPRPLGLTVEAAEVTVSTTNPLMVLHSLEFPDHDPLFFFDANLLLDRRVLDALKQRTPPCFLVSANGSPNHLVWRVGWLTQETIASGHAAVQRADQLLLTSVELADTERSSAGGPYCVKITGKDDLPRGWKLLIDRASKRPADMVEQYVDPPIENWLVHRLCETAVTPNVVTLLALAVALSAVSLFYEGWIVMAIVVAWVAIVLDGVDGKLARIKLMTSSAGRIGQGSGFFYETAWYIAWAAYLARTSDPGAWEVGTALTICNGCDQALKEAFAQFHGKPLSAMSRFDRWFNVIGGQRRIYLAMLLGGFFVGRSLLAFQVTLWWAVVTVFIHLGRVSYHVGRDVIGRFTSKSTSSRKPAQRSPAPQEISDSMTQWLDNPVTHFFMGCRALHFGSPETCPRLV
ncbi:MAG: CDP-alcohol phosphatidyltransferase family protein [Deltaproteobacteria bacterium]|nr:CDP-alcohol phosphatidyltransferase family protein [Deltaproteobacteria bacterium]